MEPSDYKNIAIAAETDKTCISCKFLRGNRNRDDLIDTWRCWKTLITKQRNPVTGHIDHYFTKENCLATRKDVEYCGPEGKWYELYEAPVYTVTKAIIYDELDEPMIAGKVAVKITDATDTATSSSDTFSPEAAAEIAARAKIKINESRIKRGLQPLP